MGQRQDAEAIAEWAEDKAKPADTPKYRRLNDVDRSFILKLRDSGRTQVQIAEQLGVSQSTISQVLDAFTDRTVQAKSYLRGQALRMAENIVENGLARDHIQALNGLGVLQEQQNVGFTLVVNGFSLHGTGPGPALEGEVLSPLAQLGSGEGQ